MNEDQIERVRRICLALPETSEQLSHGEPTFFVHKKVFVMFANNHHNDGHIAVWLAAPPGFQADLIEEAPDTFFRPPYVGHRGWIGVRLDGDVDWAEIEECVREAYRTVAPKRLVQRLAD